AAEQFLNENYLFRRNMLNGKIEFVTLKDGAETSEFRTLTQEALNSIILRAKREDICDGGNPKPDITDFIHSEEVPAFNPVAEFLEGLPAWDGRNHVAELFGRLPGVSTEHLAFLSVWLRSTVAHWLQMDTLHGNECVPTLIGPQGCGKTTFLRRLLPQHLREYYLDHLNLSNKFDKEMALTNNLIVNLDELDAIRPSQHAALKQTLSKSKVNGRPIYGCAQEDRPRFASFVATTNNPHPLTDATGSRRYICIRIPQGQYINNVGDIDYSQLYAQVLYEVRELKAPYWFGNDEVARIQELNIEFATKKDIADMITTCFRRPKEGDMPKTMNGQQMLEVIRGAYPSLKIDHSAKVLLSRAMKELGYEHIERDHAAQYKVVPLVA
ncbi:MAG: virulence-associated E family protein, partial [Bacteroidaceae bacterium]|nr:virulence-associated E family protein [Bacteroidaceae bacterium]